VARLPKLGGISVPASPRQTSAVARRQLNASSTTRRVGSASCRLAPGGRQYRKAGCVESVKIALFLRFSRLYKASEMSGNNEVILSGAKNLAVPWFPRSAQDDGATVNGNAHPREPNGEHIYCTFESRKLILVRLCQPLHVRIQRFSSDVWPFLCLVVRRLSWTLSALTGVSF
jgi:hypothetical protein